MSLPPVFRSNQVILLFILSVVVLYFGKPFFVPLTIAGILAMLFLPFCQWLERKNLSRGLSAFTAVFSFLLLIAGIFMLLGWQISGLAEDMADIQEQGGELISKVKTTISDKLGIPQAQQDAMMKEQQSSGGGKAGALVAGIMSGIMGLLVDTILVLVYMFLFLLLRLHLKKFVLKLVDTGHKKTAEKVMTESAKAAGKYLSGLGLMIVMLWVLYGIGFSIVGVKNGLFFAILCGLLEIVPFVGNITGTGITLIMALAQGGGTNMVIGVLITYGVVQFLQTYVLEPLVVGAQVKLNPLFSILAIVAGELIWGVPGMVVAIPVMGIGEIIFDHVNDLQPFGFLIGEDKK
ncbi:AI-2E family transporter [Ferruginibacter sp. HRS2-29]|uniref:AI-2E family transporter n=1 Tax=Ferruginibacter sp. HRS2-29 TaxID=2487334 RepID=UPI0020CB6CC5|nr:AI-2E family transporter [Ferruginibacter sp. HRS2-29]MCP9750560.1 AI-2E family transporter [Ferruginibacter sp. HRS2-29]